jgi:SAM-dependent methyltransferase
MASTSSQTVAQIGESARQLAQAMREGLEKRRYLGGSRLDCLARLSLHEARNALAANGDLAKLPPLARPGLLAWPIRFCRRILRTFLRPWLAVQSQHNRLVGEVLEGLNREVQVLKAWIEKDFDEMVNRELGPRGRIAGAGLWFNPAVAVQFHDGRPEVRLVSERILESIFVHTRLPSPPARVLDLGCAESTNALEIASLGYQVTGVDLRELPLTHPSLAMVKADMARLPLADDSFDVAVSLSTIEHVGLDWYGQSPQGCSDLRAADEVLRVLRPGGRFILTVPFGQKDTTDLQRIYDQDSLGQLLGRFRVVETMYGYREKLAWSVTNDVEQVRDVRTLDRTNALAMVVAEKT